MIQENFDYLYSVVRELNISKRQFSLLSQKFKWTDEFEKNDQAKHDVVLKIMFLVDSYSTLLKSDNSNLNFPEIKNNILAAMVSANTLKDLSEYCRQQQGILNADVHSEIINEETPDRKRRIEEEEDEKDDDEEEEEEEDEDVVNSMYIPMKKHRADNELKRANINHEQLLDFLLQQIELKPNKNEFHFWDMRIRVTKHIPPNIRKLRVCTRYLLAKEYYDTELNETRYCLLAAIGRDRAYFFLRNLSIISNWPITHRSGYLTAESFKSIENYYLYESIDEDRPRMSIGFFKDQSFDFTDELQLPELLRPHVIDLFSNLPSNIQSTMVQELPINSPRHEPPLQEIPFSYFPTPEVLDVKSNVNRSVRDTGISHRFFYHQPNASVSQYEPYNSLTSSRACEGSRS